jgi:hypothetical protein
LAVAINYPAEEEQERVIETYAIPNILRVDTILSSAKDS